MNAAWFSGMVTVVLVEVGVDIQEYVRTAR